MPIAIVEKTKKWNSVTLRVTSLIQIPSMTSSNASLFLWWTIFLLILGLAQCIKLSWLQTLQSKTVQGNPCLCPDGQTEPCIHSRVCIGSPADWMYWNLSVQTMSQTQFLVAACIVCRQKWPEKSLTYPTAVLGISGFCSWKFSLCHCSKFYQIYSEYSKN